MTSEPHEVSVLCVCEAIEQCETELYVADVRIAKAALIGARKRNQELLDRLADIHQLSAA